MRWSVKKLYEEYKKMEESEDRSLAEEVYKMNYTEVNFVLIQTVKAFIEKYDSHLDSLYAKAKHCGVHTETYKRHYAAYVEVYGTDNLK